MCYTNEVKEEVTSWVNKRVESTNNSIFFVTKHHTYVPMGWNLKLGFWKISCGTKSIPDKQVIELVLVVYSRIIIESCYLDFVKCSWFYNPDQCYFFWR
jgi:hypothetical protein